MTRRALIIGINYIGTNNALRGCIKDTILIKNLLLNNGYENQNITVMTDDLPKNSPLYPTKKNILTQFTNLITNVPDNSFLFTHYSGHGSQIKSNVYKPEENDNMDEALCPVDFMTAGMIIDDDVRKTLIDPLNETVNLHIIMDCCHSGSITDLKYTYKVNTSNTNKDINTNNKYSSKWEYLYYNDQPTFWKSCKKYNINKNNAYQYFSFIPAPDEVYTIQPTTSVQPTFDTNQYLNDTKAHVYVFSGCRDDQTSADASENGENFGAMTKSFTTVYKKGITYDALLKGIRQYMNGKYTQVPQLSCGRNEDLNKAIVL